jgi:hypothetical protein
MKTPQCISTPRNAQIDFPVVPARISWAAQAPTGACEASSKHPYAKHPARIRGTATKGPACNLRRRQ